jgi:hypothetical protein
VVDRATMAHRSGMILTSLGLNGQLFTDLARDLGFQIIFTKRDRVSGEGILVEIYGPNGKPRSVVCWYLYPQKRLTNLHT